MDIAFLTLFLGLVSGTIDVGLTVQGPATVLELVLDGKRVARLDGPPWSTSIDLGSGLEPHELVARAFDASGTELARQRQWLNLPRPAAEVEIALEHALDGRPEAVLLSWESLVGRPVAVELTLDGVRLPVRGARAELPAFDPDSVHLLSAALRFPEGVAARRDVVIGGLYGSAVQTELTAIPVRLRSGRMPSLDDVDGWFLADGHPVRPVAVELGSAQVFFVRELDPAEARLRLPLRLTPDASFAPDTSVRFMWPTGRTVEGTAVPIENFDASREFRGDEGGYMRLLTSVAYPLVVPEDAPRRFADAVAVAGLRAASTQRRAVVLVLGEGYRDASRFTPVAVRRYLESIGVSLHVWSLARPSKLPAAAAAWGDIQDVSSVQALRHAAARLNADLGSQRIVWLDGRHLPQAIELAPAATVTKVGR